MKKSIGKLLLALVIVFSAVMLIKSYSIQAGEGKTVRVSTAKQLKKAIKNEDVGTIILRTEAYITITIKADKAAADKFLIIDSDNVNVVNKAVFAGIEIQSANKYTESVSGNKISVTGYLGDVHDSLIISKKKQVECLTLQNVFYDPGYVLRKGAKVKELVLVMKDNGAPVELSLTAKNKTGKIHLKNEYGFIQDYKISIDKYGRISGIFCDSDTLEFACDYKYKYNSNGNVIEISGWDNENGDFTDIYTYSNGNLVKRVYNGFDPIERDYTYDSNGNKVSVKVYCEYHMDGQSWSETSYYEYEYDENDRLIYERYEDEDGDRTSENSYKYDSKGFCVEEYSNDYGLESFMTYTYNKYGDQVSIKCTSDGETRVTTYKYNKLGEPKK